MFCTEGIRTHTQCNANMLPKKNKQNSMENNKIQSTVENIFNQVSTLIILEIFFENKTTEAP